MTVINPDPANASSYYFSQYGQDAFLERFIFKGRLKDGFFIEAGSADGLVDSNTLVRKSIGDKNFANFHRAMAFMKVPHIPDGGGSLPPHNQYLCTE